MIPRRPFCYLALAASFAPLFFGCSSVVEKKYVDVKEEVRTTVVPPSAPASKWVKPQNGEFVIKRDWWKSFGDTELDKLIQAATADNIDLKLLVHRVNKAEIELKGAKRDKWPKLSASAGYSASKSSGAGTTESYDVGAGLSWEADLWGKLKQKNQSQWAKYKATEADWRAGYLSLIGDITSSYFTIRRLDEQRELHETSLATAEATLKLYKRRHEGGLEGKEKLNSQQAEVLRLSRELLELSRQRKIMSNDLAYLLGKTAGQLPVKKAALRKTVKLLSMPTKLSANLMERRPDIVAAELRVKQAYHARESDRAARLPSVSLGISGDLTSAAVNTLTSNWTAAILPKISFPFLDPATKVKLKLSEEDALVAREEYKKVVLNAIREVENALVNLGSHRKQLAVESKREEQLLAAQAKVKIRLEGGIISQLEVFETERRLLESKQKTLEIYSLILQDIVALHNALGGGWQ